MPVRFRSIAVDAGRLPIHMLANDAGAILFGIVDSQAGPAKSIHSVSREMPAFEALEIMRREDVNQLPVISASGNIERAGRGSRLTCSYSSTAAVEDRTPLAAKCAESGVRNVVCAYADRAGGGLETRPYGE